MRRPSARTLACCLAVLALASCAGHRRESARTPPRPQPAIAHGDHALEGIASWYGPGFAGRRTASGEVYDPRDLTCAHKTLPFGTKVRVRNLENGHTCWVRVNDRGPFVDGRVVDLSYSAASALGVVGPGTALVRLELERPPEAEDGVVHPVASVAVSPVISEHVPAAEDADAAAPSSEPYAPLPFTVQVGAFSFPENAEQLSSRLARRGIRARVVEEGGLAKVRVGAFDDESEAAAEADALRRDGFAALVIRDGTELSQAR